MGLLRAANCPHLPLTTRRVARVMTTTGVLDYHPVDLEAGLAHMQLKLAILAPVGVGVAAGPILEVHTDPLHGSHEDHWATIHIRLGDRIQIHIEEQIPVLTASLEEFD